MRFMMKERVFAFGDNFTIVNDTGEEVYEVKGEVISIGDRLSINKCGDKDCYYIEQQVFRFLPEYTIYDCNKEKVARVKKRFSLLSPEFDIDSIYGNYEISGDIFSKEFLIKKNTEIVTQVSKKWFSLSDTYGIEIKEGENEAFIFALIIVIDQVIYDDK